MSGSLEVLFSPAEFAALRQRDLRNTTCAVFDILRATSTMITALANGAQAILPVEDIPQALALRRQSPEVLLAGERNGVRITASLAGGVKFDLGNSPREFTPDKIRGKTIVMTTTNGTRALRACAGAQTVLIAGFLNLQTVASWLRNHPTQNLLLVCSGTYEEAAMEDTLAAGALCDLLWSGLSGEQAADSAMMSRQLYLGARADLLNAIRASKNGRRLLALPDLRDDVAYCAQRDTVQFVAGMSEDGSVRKL